MCGRYTSSASASQVQAAFAPFDLRLKDGEGLGRYNVAPTEQVLTVAAPKGQPEFELMRWGLVPSWAKDLKSSSRMINARLETVTELNSYKRLVPKGSRRALIVADGWYEWLKAEKRGEPKQPFHFQVDGGSVFAFAGLWTPAKIDEDWIHSVTILTCASAPNAVAAAIHDRMPVVLADQDQRSAWLNPDLGVEVLEMCGALPAERLTVAPANPAVNKVGGPEGPELLRA